MRPSSFSTCFMGHGNLRTKMLYGIEGLPRIGDVASNDFRVSVRFRTPDNVNPRDASVNKRSVPLLFSRLLSAAPRNFSICLPCSQHMISLVPFTVTHLHHSPDAKALFSTETARRDEIRGWIALSGKDGRRAQIPLRDHGCSSYHSFEWTTSRCGQPE